MTTLLTRSEIPDDIKALERHRIDVLHAEQRIRIEELRRDCIELLKALQPFGTIWPDVPPVLLSTGLTKIDFEHAAILYRRYRDSINNAAG
jgi:hypothetical protein